jgi:catechol 2,3-dioxygenase-like lactoylglutathione lyase family enzyme
MIAIRYIVDAARDFFVGALGFELGQQMGPPFASVTRDGLELWLAGPGSSARRPMPDGSEPAPGGWNRLVIQTDDIASVVEALRARGTRFRNEPLTGPGGTQVVVEDPSGNPIEVFQPA